jgi:phosphoribosylformylglycinamidine synthase subunit PurQ / glutaminase
MKPKVIVLSGYGLNCEEETKFVFETSGGRADIVHINDLISKKFQLSDYQIMAIGGGFAYGDDTGAGNAYANKMRNHLWKDLEKFVRSGKLVIGICNGFQILVNLGLLPALSMKYGIREMGLMPNVSARYTVRFVDVRNDSKTNSPWLDDLKSFSIMVSNGEGRLVAAPAVMKEMNRKGLIAFRYYKGPMSTYLNLPYNPNGSVEDVAGVTDETGRIIGLMPHPERAMFFTQMADWGLVKEHLKRAGKPLPEFAGGLQIFRNGVDYFLKS